LTNDIPNVSEEATKDLDENEGIEPRLNQVTFLLEKLLQRGIPLQKRNCFVQSSDKAGDERCFIKSVPSLHGVVLDKKLFARAVKDKRKRTRQGCFRALEMEYEVKFVELKTS
jgi:DNA-directed RNA polymerase subunit beta